MLSRLLEEKAEIEIKIEKEKKKERILAQANSKKNAVRQQYLKTKTKTMMSNKTIYLVTWNGRGDHHHPKLWTFDHDEAQDVCKMLNETRVGQPWETDYHVAEFKNNAFQCDCDDEYFYDDDIEYHNSNYNSNENGLKR